MTVVFRSGVAVQSVGTSPEVDLLVDGVGTPAEGARIANSTRGRWWSRPT